MQYSSDEISVDSDQQSHGAAKGLKYLPHWPAVNIEFQDLVYTVPDISGEYFIIINLIAFRSTINKSFEHFKLTDGFVANRS